MSRSDFEHNLKKCAEVIVNIGLNIQPGKRLLNSPRVGGTPFEAAPLVRLITLKFGIFLSNHHL